jgi:hypothetical protein
MDRIDNRGMGQRPGDQDRKDRQSDSRQRQKPRPVFWNGSTLERDCDDVIPVLWDGTCLE